MELTVEKLKSAYPDIHASILKEGYDKGYSEGMAKGKDEGLKFGAETERSRIKGIEEGALPGHEALVTEMKFDGKTTPEQAAVKILQAEKSLRETKLESFKMDTPPVVPPVDGLKENPPTPEPREGEPMTEEQMKHTWEGSPDIRAEYGSYDAFVAFMEAEQKGLIKIYKGGK